jgi:beta-lactamase regulating signal transducer with metallopeptidase domain
MTMWQHWMVGQVDASIAAALVLAIAVLGRRRLPPALRSSLLLIGLVRLALPPWVRSPWTEALVDVPPVDDTRMLMAQWLHADIAGIALALTAAGTAVLLARLWLDSRRLSRRWQACSPASPTLQARVNDLAAGRSITLLLSDAGEGPLAAGIRHKVIVLPRALAAEIDAAAEFDPAAQKDLAARIDPAAQDDPAARIESAASNDTAARIPPEALDAVLAHEVAHHARRDLLWIGAALVLGAVTWFNPLSYMLTRALVGSREDGSDDWAVHRTSGDPLRYVQALLQSARMVAGPHRLAAGAHPMGRRLRRLLDHRTRRDRRIGAAGSLAIVVAAAACLPGAHMPRLSTGDRIDNVVVTFERIAHRFRSGEAHVNRRPE